MEIQRVKNAQLIEKVRGLHLFETRLIIKL